jgi:hypothetical protein
MRRPQKKAAPPEGSPPDVVITVGTGKFSELRAASPAGVAWARSRQRGATSTIENERLESISDAVRRAGLCLQVNRV